MCERFDTLREFGFLEEDAGKLDVSVQDAKADGGGGNRSG